MKKLFILLFSFFLITGPAYAVSATWGPTLESRPTLVITMDHPADYLSYLRIDKLGHYCVITYSVSGTGTITVPWSGWNVWGGDVCDYAAPNESSGLKLGQSYALHISGRDTVNNVWFDLDLPSYPVRSLTPNIVNVSSQSTQLLVNGVGSIQSGLFGVAGKVWPYVLGVLVFFLVLRFGMKFFRHRGR